MAIPRMHVEAADWVLENVLPRRYLTSVAVRPLDIRVCACQWGPTGHCAAGHHLKCARTLGWPGHGGPDWETHIVSRSDWAALAPVWRTGTPCRWLCPCKCHNQIVPLFDPPARRPGRTRVGGNCQISYTDGALRDRNEPTLFELTAGGPDG